MYGATLTPSDMGTYDSDAASYFALAEALGGTFDRTNVDPAYPADVVKAAIDDFVRGLKEDGIWPLLTEIYLLCGVSYGGMTAKLKYAGTPVVYKVNFLAEDFLSVGSGLGLKGGNLNKVLETGKLVTDFNPYSMHMMACLTQAASGGASVCHIGASVTGGLLLLGRANSGADEAVDFAGGGTTRPSVTVASRDGIFIGNSTAQNARTLYRNGSSIGTNSVSATSAFSSTQLTLFAATAQLFSNARIAVASIGSPFTPTQVTNYTNHINTLTTTLGDGIF